jgi:3-hydroxyisobutyrate dehydrogenase-like beta-hydroxyacid dehydrogenase
MGLPVCTRLVNAGYEVVATDVRADRQRAVCSTGATWKSDTRAVIDTVDVLVTVLPGSVELHELMTVAMPVLRREMSWIDMTSASPAIGRGLAVEARKQGAEYLDSPLGGGVSAAESGKLQLFVGGDAETLARHRTMLEALGRIEHVGGQGAGYTVKLLVNLLWFGQAVAVAEALLLARREAVDIEVLRDVLGRSSAASEFIRRDLDSLLDGDYLESFGLDRCCEELTAIAEIARDTNTPFELSTEVQRAYARALRRYGPVDGELLAVALLEERAGTKLRRA